MENKQRVWIMLLDFIYYFLTGNELLLRDIWLLGLLN